MQGNAMQRNATQCNAMRIIFSRLQPTNNSIWWAAIARLHIWNLKWSKHAYENKDGGKCTPHNTQADSVIYIFHIYMTQHPSWKTTHVIKYVW